MASILCGFLRSSVRPLIRFKSDAHIAMTNDSSTIVFWHPEPTFQYEKSLPIPEKRVVASDSILKVQSKQQMMDRILPKRDEVVRAELMRLTYSTKHVWFPKGKQFRKKKLPDPDRPYL